MRYRAFSNQTVVWHSCHLAVGVVDKSIAMALYAELLMPHNKEIFVDTVAAKAVHESFANQAKKQFLHYFRLQVKIHGQAFFD